MSIQSRMASPFPAATAAGFSGLLFHEIEVQAGVVLERQAAPAAVGLAADGAGWVCRPSSVSNSPQLPVAWNARKNSGDCPASCSAAIAPGVATMRPSLNFASDMTAPFV